MPRSNGPFSPERMLLEYGILEMTCPATPLTLRALRPPLVALDLTLAALRTSIGAVFC